MSADIYSDRTPTLEALESIYMDGFADAVDGDVDSEIGHFYRVGRCIVCTDSQGFHCLHVLNTEALAHDCFDALQYAYSMSMEGYEDV